MAGTPPPAGRKRKELLPSPGSGLPSCLAITPAPAPPPKLTLLYLFRPVDKHASVQFQYPHNPYQFVDKKDCMLLVNICTALQREGIIKLHGKERYKKGEYGVKEANPLYDYYPGYGNHEDVGIETLPAARFIEVTKARFDEAAADLIQEYKFQAVPEKKGDKPVPYETAEAFIEHINSVPEPKEPEEEEEPAPAWRAQVEARLAALEKAAGLISY